MKFITISKPAKDTKTEGQYIWALSINLKNGTSGTADGVNYFYTTKSYYLDRKLDKVRFQNMKTDNTSYDKLVDIYLELYPGIYNYFSIATENNISEKLDNGVKAVKEFKIGGHRVENFRKNLVFKN